MSAQEETQLVHRPVFLIPKDTGPMTIAQEFATAKYALSKNQLKAWYLFIASMDENHVPEQSTTYVFDALRFADKLNIDARKARGMMVAEIFTKLSQNYIDLRSRGDDNGEQDIYHANFISELSYNRKTHILRSASLHDSTSICSISARERTSRWTSKTYWHSIRLSPCASLFICAISIV